MFDRRIDRLALFVFFAFLLIASVGWSTQVTGSLTYDGEPVSATFPEITFGSISAYNTATAERTSGSVNVAQGTYQLDVPEGTYNVSIVLGEDEDIDFWTSLPGNLWGNLEGVTVGSGGTETIDILMYFIVHVTAPYDNQDFGAGWGGSVLECPYGPEVSSTFRLQWLPVPRADRYEVVISYFNCDGWVRSDTLPTSGTFVDVVIDPAEAENVEFFIRGVGSTGLSVTAMPYLYYDNGSAGSNGHWLHAGPGGEGRPIHSVDSLVLLQIANLPGVGTSFWTSDITLSNPGSSAVLAKLTFTPRDAQGLIDYTTKTYQLPAYSCRTIKDVVGTLFGVTDAGSLEISPAAIQAYARTATSGDDGSYGQSFPAVAVDGERWASLAGGEIIRAGGVIRGPFRTNLILAEIWGESATAEVKLVGMNGGQLGVRAVTLPALGNVQINDVVRALTGDADLQLEDAQVQVEVQSGGGRVAGALSIVAQGSDDPITVILE